MIIDFSVSNFRSIRNEQTLSMFVSKPRSHLPTHVAYPTGDKVGVLRSVGLYGANASGKSNVLLAFHALRYMVLNSESLKEGQSIPCYEPYRLSEESKHAPVKFEIEFVTEGIRYIYSIAYDEYSVVEESLDFFPSRQKANLFKRNASDTWETVSFGGLLKGGERRISFFKNSSYLSKAGNHAASPERIRTVYNYFRKSLTALRASQELYVTDYSLNADNLRKVSEMLCRVDTGVTEIRKNEKPEAPDIIFPEGISESLKRRIIERNSDSFLFLHKTELGEFESFKEDIESEGTQRLFSLMPLLLRLFENGGVLIADELDRSLHPHIAELIIKLFNDSEVNRNGAQLIFSTHNITLMTPQHLRRDQIWFTEKRAGATELTSLADFDKQEVKSDSPYGSWYDEGRFGAFPRIDYSALARILQPSVNFANGIESVIPCNCEMSQENAQE